MNGRELSKALRSLANPTIAEHSQRFFKTGKGEYGEGDLFLGIRVPVLRAHARKFRDIPLRSLRSVLKSRFHEERLCALIILVKKFEKGTEAEREEIYKTYLANTKYSNGWDLVDSSAHQIVGGYLVNKDRGVLQDLARSASLWERRIAIIATLQFIKDGDHFDTLEIAQILLNDSEDLIHKAVGWMLREVGNRDPGVERMFLKKHYKKMPRTMLRYAIEKFPEAERKQYLNGKI